MKYIQRPGTATFFKFCAVVMLLVFCAYAGHDLYPSLSSAMPSLLLASILPMAWGWQAHDPLTQLAQNPLFIHANDGVRAGAAGGAGRRAGPRAAGGRGGPRATGI